MVLLKFLDGNTQTWEDQTVEKRSEPQLKFKSLSDGLGFHPFENGLPYTPSTPQREGAPQGTGAVTAGRPSFVFPETIKAAPVLAPQVLQPRINPSVDAATTQASAITPKTGSLTPELGLEYVAKRFFAFFIDSLINCSLGIGALLASLWNEGISAEYFLNADIWLATLAFLLFFNWALITAQEVALGCSLGKKLFGLSVEGSASAVLVRALFFIPSLLVFGLGLLWMAFDSNRRGLHDLISGIQPEES